MNAKGMEVQASACATVVKDIAAHLIARERAALERWGQGDPDGYLAISAPDVVYFDPFQERRLDGLDNLRALYETLRGQIKVDRFDLLNPKVQLAGDVAVLTFNLVSHMGAQPVRWNCTEVYRRDGAEWFIIQSHWSFTRHPGVAG